MHSTINANLQRAAEAALQEGLAHYEIANGRMQYSGPEANLARRDAKARRRRQTGARARASAGVATGARRARHLPLYDVHWDAAVVLDKGGKRGDGAIHVGLADGRVVPLNAYTSARSGAR